MAESKIIAIENNSSFFQGLNEMRLSGLFCDITVKIENQRFPAHQCVLVPACKYFENMLAGNFVENKTKTINLKGLDPDVFEILLEFIYTGILSIDRENVVDVFKMADFLQLQWAKDECSRYLFDSLTKENCVEMWQLGRNYGDELQYKANEFIAKNLESVQSTEQFKKLNLEKMEEIFQHDRMLSKTADVIFMATMQWLKYDLPNRKADFHVLSKYISKYMKKDSVFEEFLKFDISKGRLITENYSVRNWMSDNLSFSEIPQYNSNKETNIFISGLLWDSTCYKLDTETKKCTSLRKPYGEYYFPVHYKNNIYFTGGAIEDDFTKVCQKYNIETEVWSEIAFDIDRRRHGSFVVNDEMYIIGGECQESFKKETQMYDLNRGQLISLKSKINNERIAFGVATQGGAVYVCGGENWLNSVERFDPREGKFVLLPDMEDLTGRCTAAFVSHELYCSGRGIVKKFDIRMNSWENVSNLPPNANNSLVESGGQLYSCQHESISYFNRNENHWQLFYPMIQMIPIYSNIIAISY